MRAEGRPLSWGAECGHGALSAPAGIFGMFLREGRCHGALSAPAGIFGMFLRGFGRLGSYQLVPRRKRVKGLQGGEPGAGHPVGPGLPHTAVPTLGPAHSV